jgi:hypothetical protein
VKLLIAAIICFFSFPVYAATIDSCTENENALWIGLKTYQGPVDRHERIKDVISKGAWGLDNALTVAVWFGYDDVIEKLLQDRANIEKYGAQSLHLAASMGRLKEMSMLLDAGVLPNSQIENGFTPIYGAAEHGCMQAMQLLIDAGEDVNHRANVRWTLLEDAVISKQFDAARFLVTHGYVTDDEEKKKIQEILHRMEMDSKYVFIFGNDQAAQ